ncbi:MAG: succinylglutamate desuccinylase/aspartoacylase family protein [Ardenticatenaceae bacterium]|nr:succinylglutamate desuccinylase/aspartoacylase family protein [Ardenticatenaceae bacterium]
MNTQSDAAHPLDLARGTKGKGWLEVGQSPGGRPLGIPWMAIRGNEDGPTLTVNCAIHGDEYEGGEAIRQLWRELDPATLAGAWIGVPVVNIAAYDAAQRNSPLDNVNMNRIFPGDSTASISGMVAQRFFHDIVRHSNAVIDFHAGGSPLSIVPIVAFSGGDSPQSAKSRELAVQAGVDLLWEMPTIWGGSIVLVATEAGIPTITPEIGNDGRIGDEYIQISRQIITNVMAFLGMQEGRPVLPPRQRVVRGSYVYSRKGGLFRSTVPLGAEVEEGQVVATIRNVFGDVVEEIAAPRPGVICSYRTIPPILPGDQTTFVGQVIDVIEHEPSGGRSAM